MEKKLVMIESFGIRRVDPAFCPHEHTVFIRTGHVYTFMGEYDDDLDCYEQCLLCGAVRQDDGTWGLTLDPEKPESDDEDEIAF